MSKPNDKKRPNSSSGSLAHFKRWRDRLLHLSAPLHDHPLWIHAARIGRLIGYTGPRYQVGIGTTLDVRRNDMKRKRRALKIEIAGSERAYDRQQL